MKIAVMMFFSSQKIKNENEPHFIEWDYPVLPRMGEFVCNQSRFLSEKRKESFRKIMLSDIIYDSNVPGTPRVDDESLYDYYSDQNNDHWVVKSVEWLYDEENGDYPLITIFEQ
jgi:hypothetical protein